MQRPQPRVVRTTGALPVGEAGPFPRIPRVTVRLLRFIRNDLAMPKDISDQHIQYIQRHGEGQCEGVRRLKPGELLVDP